jgi:hypothetical protein
MSLKETQDKLRDLAQCIAEPIPTELGEKIRRRIPRRLHHHWGKDAVNIIIHFRISRLTAVITILLTLVACWILFGPSDRGDTPLYREIIGMDWLPGEDADYDVVRSAVQTRYRWLIEQGYEAEYYGDIIDFQNDEDMVLYWRIDEERYRVIFADLKPRIVSAKELVHLQTQMLKRLAQAD